MRIVNWRSPVVILAVSLVIGGVVGVLEFFALKSFRIDEWVRGFLAGVITAIYAWLVVRKRE